MSLKAKSVLLVFTFFILSSAKNASAHIKWFVPENEVESNPANFLPFYHLTDKASILWALIGVLILLCAWYLDKKFKAPEALVKFGTKYEPKILRIFQFFVGLFLIAISIGWKIVLVPTLGAADYAVWSLLALQALAGLMFIVNFKPKAAAWFLVLLYIAVSLLTDLDVLLENILLMGIAAYIYLAHTKENEFLYKFASAKTAILRVSAGASLIVLAFTEKLLHPELSMYFLSTHHWNFMQRLGFYNFTDSLFVLSVGAMEAIFGALLISGKLTRVTTIALACFFAISVVSMLAWHGKWEVEDLVIYAAAIVLIIYGKK